MSITGKAYYWTPSRHMVDPVMGDSYEPLAAKAIEQNGGSWAVCARDSNTAPTWFIIAVSDRPGPSAARNTAVHTQIAMQAPGTIWLGSTFAEVVLKAENQVGAAIAHTMPDQTVGGE